MILVGMSLVRCKDITIRVLSYSESTVSNNDEKGVDIFTFHKVSVRDLFPDVQEIPVNYNEETGKNIILSGRVKT